MVPGLTTAACLRLVAAVGLAVGTGHYAPAAMVAMIALFNVVFLKQIERLIKKDHFCILVIQNSSAGENPQNRGNL